MRNIAIILPLLLAACGSQSNGSSTATGNAQAVPAGEKIDCAPAGTTAFARNCTVEDTRSASALILTVRRPDGGFRRLQVVSDGRGVLAADGAEPAKVALVGDGRIEVAIGGDRYRLPATVKAQAGQ